MLKHIQYSLLVLFVILTSNNVFAQKYAQISTEKQTESDQIIIYEFFWYGCPHCFNLEPTMDRIEADLDKDARVVKVPVALRDSWLPHAKLYYSLSQMDMIDNIHNLIFEEIHLEDNRLDNEDVMAQFLGKNGIDTKDFREKYNSYGTEARIKKASNLARKYQINSVPTIVVNGKYLTSGSFVSSYDELYSVVNLLVERERNE